jgi:transposase
VVTALVVLVALTVADLRRLLASLVWRRPVDPAFTLAWSIWRCRHQPPLDAPTTSNNAGNYDCRTNTGGGIHKSADALRLSRQATCLRQTCLDSVSLLWGDMTGFLAMTTTLVEELVPDELWQVVAALLPVPPRPRYGGRRRTVPDRNCLAAIVYMARTSTPWRLLPARELGCGSPATVWRRLDEWAKAGVFDALHLEVLDRLGIAGRLDWTRASVDTMSVRAKRGGTTWAQIPSIAASQGPNFT